MNRSTRQALFVGSVFTSCACLGCASLAIAGNAHFVELKSAEQLLLRGNYQECQAAFTALREQFPVPATLGLARSHWQRGQQTEAIAQLDRQLKLSPGSAPLHAERALLALLRGDVDVCRVHIQFALQAKPDHVQARWVQAELLRIVGKIDQACAAYRELAVLYDQQRQKFESPRRLYWFGRAIAQHARFNQDQKRFRELTQQIYPRLLSLEPNFWPAHHQIGVLLQEKFNAADAETSFHDALQINSQATDAQVGLARLALQEFQLDRVRRHLDRALKANPNHLGAHHGRADLEFACLQPSQALQALTNAQKLNAHDANTLGRMAAAHQLLSTPTDDTHSAAIVKLTDRMNAFTENTGEFHLAWGAALEQARRYPQAGKRLRAAIDAMPQLLGPRGRLGMIEMRLGHEAVAHRWLEESFRRDPYNVRVKNQLEVLDLLDDYAKLETEHFIIRYHAEHDKQLAKCMARYAEQCYDELSTTFDFQLPEQALLEVFRDGRGVKARQWFGARMVGLPNIHTIAACSGNVVAMVSPTAERRKLNWADILRHEIVHLFHIQQTDYAVPHWLTEGCAVWQEGRPRRQRWEKLLVSRVPRGEVFDLSSINLGFLRPRSPDDWQLAYCQAEIYVELIAVKHGEEGIRRLLAAYRDNLPIEQAFAKRLGTKRQQIEQLCVEYLGKTVASLSERDDLREMPKLTDARARWEADPADLDAGAELALVRLRQGDYPGAGRLAERVLAKDPAQLSARFVKAKLLLQIGDEKAAAKQFADLVNPDSPHTESLKLLAGIHLRGQEFNEAKRWYQLGADRQPSDLQWTKALAVVAIRQQDTAELNRLLTRIANAEPDNLVARKKLLQLSKQGDQQAEIEQWANEVLHIDPNDRTALRALGKIEL